MILHLGDTPKKRCEDVEAVWITTSFSGGEVSEGQFVIYHKLHIGPIRRGCKAEQLIKFVVERRIVLIDVIQEFRPSHGAHGLCLA